jgi:hypothetical protein
MGLDVKALDILSTELRKDRQQKKNISRLYGPTTDTENAAFPPVAEDKTVPVEAEGPINEEEFMKTCINKLIDERGFDQGKASETCSALKEKMIADGKEFE